MPEHPNQVSNGVRVRALARTGMFLAYTYVLCFQNAAAMLSSLCASEGWWEMCNICGEVVRRVDAIFTQRCTLCRIGCHACVIVMKLQ